MKKIPDSFKAHVREMTDEQLLDLRDWNTESANANRHANAVLDEELKRRGYNAKQNAA